MNDKAKAGIVVEIKNRVFKEIRNINIFDGMRNFNGSIVGGVGAGKGVLIKTIAADVLRQGGKAFIFDDAKDYGDFSYGLAGRVISVGKDICVNPFSTIKDRDSSMSVDEYNEYLDIMFNHLSHIVDTMAAPKRGLDDLQKSKISKAVREVWKLHHQETNITKIAEYLQNQEDDQVAHELSKLLHDYTEHGVYGDLFNGTSNVDFSGHLTIIDTEDLKWDVKIKHLVEQILLLGIVDHMRHGDRRTRFVVALDNAWQELADINMTRFIRGISHGFRRLCGSLIISSQSINDFQTNSCAQDIFENSNWKFLMAEYDYGISRLREYTKDIFLANLKHLKKLKTVYGEYSEFLVSANGIS
ncbi:MAG: ATP-binding protein, partial [Legionellales bacterium]|nr:ATP-binding protein [Legionellales bacterium]